MDLSQLSTEDLMRMRSGVDLSSVPTEALLKMRPEKPSALVRVGRGVADVTEGIGQAARYVGEKIGVVPPGATDAYTREKTEDIKAYERGRGDAGIDWMRLGGNVGATLPALLIPGGGASSLAVRAASGAGQGAAASGAMFTPEGESKVAQTTLGALFGGAVPVAANQLRKGGSAALDALTSRIRPQVTVNPQQQQALAGEISLRLQREGVDFGRLTNDVRQSLINDAQRALSAGGTLDDAMLGNKALIESIGARPTRAAVTRNPKDWQTEQNLRGVTGVGEPIAARHQENATAMVDYLARLRAQTGGRASTPYEAGEAPIQALRAQDAAKEAVVDDLYRAFRSTGTQGAHVPDTRIAETLGRVADEIGVENIPAPVLSRMKEFGFLGGERTKLLTVNEADKLNRLINNNNPGRGPASLALRDLKQSLNEALLEVPGSAAELRTARAAAAQRFAEQRAGKGITAAIDDVSPDRFVKRFVVDADVRDVRAMWDELAKSPQGSQARADVKGHLLDSLLMKATRATNPDDVAGRPFSGVMFSKALDAIPPEKLHVMFSPAEIESLRTLQRASKLLTEEVPFSDVNHSKTAAALSNLLLKIGSTPLIGQMLSPIIGAGKIGMDWVKNATERKQVAEILLGSAGNPAVQAPRVLAAPNRLERVLPGALAGAGAGTND